MPKRVKKSNDPSVIALRVAMALRGWEKPELAEAMGVSLRNVQINFRNDFSSKALRIRVNEVFGEKIFTEGVG